MQEVWIKEERLEVLSELETIPIRFTVRSVLALTPIHAEGGYRITERSTPSYEKDYDVDSGAGPSQWPRQFGVDHWGVLGAWTERGRVGSAVVAMRTPALDILEGRDDLAVLWDLRVHPDCRGKGIGSKLFRAAENWASTRGCVRLKVETQNVNVDACKFYAKQGCVIGEVNPHAYPSLPAETQIIWYKELT